MCIISLNSIVVPNIITNTLTRKEWSDVIKVDMEGFKKYSTREIVDKPKRKEYY